MDMREQVKEFDEHFGSYISGRTCNILPQENSEEYRKLDEEADRILEQLQGALPDELHKLLNDLDDKLSAMTDIEGELKFMAGFMDGIIFAGRVKRR